MLSKIEAAFTQCRVWTMDELASFVGVSPELVRAGIEQLKRMGRLRENAVGQIEHCANPTHHCNRCAFQGLCMEDETSLRKVAHAYGRAGDVAR
ncbi:FeoC-like transcriptional regulator [Alicyclobacillus kakegawensis]|uniref:FeoC-like transcriptional regulator n=1 Tax=Alicyclobacillus kakegawensis TaxID=392012 RepID=UPI0008375C50|nr:FeoC-like transcriptional regulator [Alicyclobacillus kakegawensis]